MSGGVPERWRVEVAGTDDSQGREITVEVGTRDPAGGYRWEPIEAFLFRLSHENEPHEALVTPSTEKSAGPRFPRHGRSDAADVDRMKAVVARLEQGPAIVSELADALGHASTLAAEKVVGRLIAQGLVEVRHRPKARSRGFREFHLTDAGRRDIAARLA